jgi:hypothetical protein
MIDALGCGSWEGLSEENREMNHDESCPFDRERATIWRDREFQSNWDFLNPCGKFGYRTIFDPTHETL